MAKRLVCCPDSNGNGFEYLYLDTSKLLVENVTDEIVVLANDAKERCCFDELSGYALGEKALQDKEQDLFSFDFYKINSFELFNTQDELRFKTGSAKILSACLLNYYRREYDGTQQHTFFSEPTVNNTFVDTGTGVEHELLLENRELVKNKKDEDLELETLDKGKTDAEREAEAAVAQAEAEQIAALAEAEDKAAKKEKQKNSRRRRQWFAEEEQYREFRNQDNVQSEEFRRMREYEEEMRRNNSYLSSQYGQGNYSSLPGMVSNAEYISSYGSAVGKETLEILVDNTDLYRLASRMDEFGVPYTVIGEETASGKLISHIICPSDYASTAYSARDFAALEKNLQFDGYTDENRYFNAFQLSALEYAYDNNVDVSYVANGEYNSNQMYRIFDAGLNGYDMQVLANPSYTPAHMDALTYYMRCGWNTADISDPTLSPGFIADKLLQEEISHGVPRDRSFFEQHDYDGFVGYNPTAPFSNNYDNSQREQYYKQFEINADKAASQKNLQTFKENLHTTYEQRQRETNYIPAESTKTHPTETRDSSFSPHSSPSKSDIHGAASGKTENTPVDNNKGQGQNQYSFNSSYTLTGYNKSDGSFVPYAKNNSVSADNRAANLLNMPARRQGPGAGAPPNGGVGKAPVSTPPSNKARYNPLNDLKVRSEFAKRSGYALQNFGASLKHIPSSMAGSTLRKAAQADETGAIYGYNSISRTASNATYTARLVMDLPRQFARAGQKMKYGSASVAKACKESVGKNYTRLTSADIKKDIQTLKREQKHQLEKLYGKKASKLTVGEIKTNISRFNKQINELQKSNKALRNEIKVLYDKKKSVGLSSAEKIVLKDKLNKYSNNTAKINKNKKKVSKLEKLRGTKKAHAKALGKLDKAAEKMGKREGRWKGITGMLSNSLVNQLYKAGNDHTVGGMATASSIAMRYLRSPLHRTVRNAGSALIGKPMKKATRKLVRKTKTYKKYRLRRIKRTQRIKKKVLRKQKLVRIRKRKIKRASEKLFGKAATKGLLSVYRGTGKGFAFVNKIVGGAFRAISSALSFLKGIMLKVCLWLGIGFVGIALLATIANALMSAASSVVLVGGNDDDKINLTEYVETVNSAQQTLQAEINALANGTGISGNQYDNVFYDYVGNSGNNTAQIIAMAYIRFGGLVEDYPEEVESYIKQLYADSNYADYAVSEPYACDNGCVKRDYFCYDTYDQYATETRKSLYASSKGKGCIKTKAYSCMTEVILGYHNGGKLMSSPCSCDNCKPFRYASYEPVAGYYCQGYTGEVYNKHGCNVHNNGNKMSSPCSCDDYKVETESTTVVRYYCQGYYTNGRNPVFKQHNKGEAMSKPCSCSDCEKKSETVETRYYYCQGYCPGNHYDYSCEGHTEKICYGKHQDITITITSLDFDDIFYADSSVAQTGTSLRGEAYDDKFVVSAYCSCKECCGEYSPEVTGKPSTTASGTTPKQNHTLAVDYKNPVVPMGTHVWIDGKEYVVEDTGDLASRGVAFDMYFNSHQSALQWGRRTKTVYKNVLVSEDDSVNLAADEYGFKGWTEENVDLAKNIYKGLVGDEANDIYAGLDKITNLAYGSSDVSDYDFSDIVFDDADGLTKNQQKILAVIEKNTIATKKGYCQAWVADVYQAALGGARVSKCCANHAGEAWGVSNDWSKIQVGAAVYGYSSSKYGHVGIYIGNGKIAHNIGYVKIQSLESWVKTYNGQCWGWNGGNNLSGKSQYKCKPAGTFMRGKD